MSKEGRDLTLDEEKSLVQAFNDQTKEFEKMAGDKVKDSQGNEIEESTISPILRNRAAATPGKWTRVEGLEWGERSLGSFFIVSEMQAEHHKDPQKLQDVGENGRGFIYFYPEGYVEKSYVRVSFKRDHMVVDEDQKPYTLVTNPYLGTAEIQAGVLEIDVHDLSGEE